MGVANYFSVDVSIVRILFLISIFFGGFGVLIYFILWFITPEATTVGEKMSMKGYSVTLENIEKYVEEKINPEDKEENILMKIKKEVIIFEDINKVFKIINTVENYKNFVPYCNDSFITENSDGTIKGTLKFNLKGFDVTFTTNNSSKHNENINMVLNEGPFKNLEGSFVFKQIKW